MKKIIKWCVAMTLCGAVYLAAQSQIDGIAAATASSVFNLSSAAVTRVLKVGTSDPGTCTVGDLIFRSDLTAGQNIKGCTSTNTWTAQGGSGSGGGGLGSFSYSTGIVRSAIVTGNAGSGQITSHNLFLGSISGTSSYVAAANGVPPYRQLQTAATTNSDAYEYTGNGLYYPADDPQAIIWAKFPEYTAQRIFVGFSQSAPATQQGADDGSTASFAGFRCSTNASDTNWIAITKDGTTAGTTDTGVACGTTAHVFEVGTTDGGTTWVFKIDGSTVASRTTNVPVASVGLYCMVASRTLENVAKNLHWSAMQITHKPW